VAIKPEKSIVVIVANMARTLYKHRLPLILDLKQAGYRVVLAAPFDESVGALLDTTGTEFISLKYFRRNSIRPAQELKALLELHRLVGNLHPSIILTFGIQSVVLGNLAVLRKKGILVVSVITGLGYTFLHPGRLSWAVRCLLKWSLKRSAAVVLENQDDLDWITAKKLARPEQTLLIPGSGVDLDHFRPEARPEHSGKIVFTFIGRLLYDKGLREFAEAAIQVKRSCPEAAFWIIGPLDDDNPAHVDQKDLLQWVRSGAVQYKGVVEDVRPLLAQTDWVVLPSYREGLSRVLLEAMAMAKPLITTNTPGCKETVEPGRNGFLVPMKDAQALADVIRKCCSMPQEAVERMGDYSRKQAARYFGSSRINRQFLSLLHKIESRN
jgi:glycosyltransferase involved in cell wall biosynthesis